MDYKGKQPYTTTIEEVDDDTIDELDFRLPNVEAVVPHSMPQSERVKYVTDDTAFKSWVCLYPAYFDKSRSVQQGRRVMKALAVDRPRARQIAEAASSLELQILYEPDKIYPRDLLNPGRVKVQLRLENGQLASPTIPNRRTLYYKVAALLPDMINTVQVDEPLYTEEEIAKELKSMMDRVSSTNPATAMMGGSMPGDDGDAVVPVNKKGAKQSGSSKKKNKSKGKGTRMI